MESESAQGTKEAPPPKEGGRENEEEEEETPLENAEPHDAPSPTEPQTEPPTEPPTEPHEAEEEEKEEAEKMKEPPGPTKLFLTVSLVDGTTKKIACISNELVNDVRQRAAEKFDLQHPEFFFLSYAATDSEGNFFDHWLNGTSTLDEEDIAQSTPPHLWLLVKYGKIPRVLTENERLLDLFYVQIQQSVLKGAIGTPEKVAIQLATLELAASFGPFKPGVHNTSFLTKVGLDHYLPACVSQHGMSYWHERLVRNYSKLQDTTKKQAKMEYIRYAQKNLVQFNLLFFSGRNEDGYSVLLGAGEDGIHLFDRQADMCISSMFFSNLVAVREDSDMDGVYIDMQRPTEQPPAVEEPQVPTEEEKTTEEEKAAEEKDDGIDSFFFVIQQPQRRIFLDIVNGLASLLPESYEVPSNSHWPTPPAGLEKQAFNDILERKMSYTHGSTQLEFLKWTYASLCMQNKVVANSNFSRLVDTCIDDDTVLERLDLPNFRLGDAEWERIVESLTRVVKFPPRSVPLGKNLALISLNLRGNLLTSAAASDIHQMFETFPMLVNVDLSHNGLDNKAAQAFSRAMTNLTALSTLSLGHNDIGNKGFMAILDATRRGAMFTTLHVEYNRITDTGAIHLSDVLEHNSSLSDISIAYNRIGPSGMVELASVIPKCRQLQALMISGNPIGAKGCAVLPEMLLQSSLVSLGAADLRMTRDVALRLAQAAKASPHLVSLDIHSNRIGVKMTDVEAKQFCEMVASTKGGAKVLRDLNLAENDFDSLFSAALGAALAENETLEVLNLRGNPICTSDTGLLPREFVLSITGSESLMHLDLSACGLSAAGVSGFFDAFVNNRSIIELRLVGNTVDDAVTTIAGVLKKDEVYLRVLDISSTKLGSSGVIELVEALETNKQLTSLSVRDCGMTLTAIPAMLEHLSKNSTLQTMDLRENGLPSKLPDVPASDARCLL
eukprot:TRINITY_DN15586_c0_g1_i1.p1 TRINITY_DN15586_c0_g1~~TRINITY_DN15586_c0_g1_i1.p1  ORF type:complete len:950 (+),score=293.96 TRINITY_DN15586_c0_g1_i1:126-2975(+)